MDLSCVLVPLRSATSSASRRSSFISSVRLSLHTQQHTRGAGKKTVLTAPMKTTKNKKQGQAKRGKLILDRNNKPLTIYIKYGQIKKGARLRAHHDGSDNTVVVNGSKSLLYVMLIPVGRHHQNWNNTNTNEQQKHEPSDKGAMYLANVSTARKPCLTASIFQ